MKLLVFADTHNSHQRMLNMTAKHEQEVDAILHLGDGVNDANKVAGLFPHIPLYQVYGNCDYSRGLPSESLDHFGDLLFFYTHGHAFGVKEDLDRLFWEAKKRGATAALYGHTHIPNYTFRGGIHLFSPGSLTMPRFGPPTYGLVTIDNAVPTFEILKYEA